MPELDDITLLGEFAETGSEAAFAVLVERYINLIYSTALRSVGNAHVAEEITQAVFIILAKKAQGLTQRIVLSGWLYQTTRLTAANFLRGEIRRQRREQEAYMQSLLNEPEPEVWPQIAPLLDAAMGRLGEKDRNAILLRYFENKNLSEIGLALGASEDAAKMRVNRALEKLRKFFTKRGVTLSSIAIAGAVSANSVQAAPVALTTSVTTVAIAKGAAASGSTLTLVKGALKIMAWAKAKLAVVVVVGVLFAVGTTTVTLKEIRAHETFPWQSRIANSDILRRVPPQVKIAPAKFPDTMGAGMVSIENGKTMGISQTAKAILAAAYGQSSTRIIILDTNRLPQGRYDFIANLPSGNEEGLQREIRRKFDLVGRRETREMDVLLLQIQNSVAPGLKPADPRHLKPNQGNASMSSGAGYYSCRNMSMASLAAFLEEYLDVPVVDRTGLTRHFDIDLKWDETNWQHPNLEDLKQALRDQLGLELVPGREPVEMLVVEKAD